LNDGTSGQRQCPAEFADPARVPRIGRSRRVLEIGGGQHQETAMSARIKHIRDAMTSVAISVEGRQIPVRVVSRFGIEPQQGLLIDERHDLERLVTPPEASAASKLRLLLGKLSGVAQP
jgi:hypothetical protein